MASSSSRRPRRSRGSIETLPSGALRVKVYAGLDPITKQRHYLTETVERTTPKATKVAEQIRTRFLNQVDEKRNPRTNANVRQLLNKYLSEFGGAAKTKNQYRGLNKKHIDRFLGDAKVGGVHSRGRLELARRGELILRG
jgi:integrase